MMTITPGTVVHRIGGRAIENLRLRPGEDRIAPVGISVLLDGTPVDAARRMLAAYPRATRMRAAAAVVASASVAAVRAAGYDVIADPSQKLPTHGRLIHAAGAAGFNDADLAELAAVLQESEGLAP